MVSPLLHEKTIQILSSQRKYMMRSFRHKGIHSEPLAETEDLLIAVKSQDLKRLEGLLTNSAFKQVATNGASEAKPDRSEAFRTTRDHSRRLGRGERIDMAKPQQAICHLFEGRVSNQKIQKDMHRERVLSAKMAAKTGWSQGLDLLLGQDSCNRMFLGGEDHTVEYNLLHLASFSGDLSTIQLLLDKGLSVNQPTGSPYQEGIDEKDFWDWLDWDSELENGKKMLRLGGYLHPVMSPLWITLHFHPEKKELHEYLRMKGAVETFKPSVNGESPENLFWILPHK